MQNLLTAFLMAYGLQISHRSLTQNSFQASLRKFLACTQVEGRRVDESIPQWLHRKKLLLILDNCEHVLEPVAAIADAIMRSCPDVRMLATSRQALGVNGEVVHRLPSLAVPGARLRT